MAKRRRRKRGSKLVIGKRPKGRPPPPYKSWEEYWCSLHLASLKGSGRIRQWAYEPRTIKFTPHCQYTPDFQVLLNSGITEYHEVKATVWRTVLRTKQPPDLDGTRPVHKRTGEWVLKRAVPNFEGPHRATVVKLQWAATNYPLSIWLVTWFVLGEWKQKRYPW